MNKEEKSVILSKIKNQFILNKNRAIGSAYPKQLILAVDDAIKREISVQDIRNICDSDRQDYRFYNWLHYRKQKMKIVTTQLREIVVIDDIRESEKESVKTKVLLKNGIVLEANYFLSFEILKNLARL